MEADYGATIITTITMIVVKVPITCIPILEKLKEYDYLVLELPEDVYERMRFIRSLKLLEKTALASVIIDHKKKKAYIKRCKYIFRILKQKNKGYQKVQLYRV